MQRLTKGPEPQALQDNAAAWRDQLLAARAAGQPYTNLENRYRRDDVRDALREECHRKCAYCESRIDAVAYDNIEHIEPKSKVPALTFEWENLTLACPKCNTNKGHERPTAQNYIHPYNENPEDKFWFLGPIIFGNTDNLTASNMIAWLELNRPGLLEARAEVVYKVNNIYDTARYLDIADRRPFIDASLAPLIRNTAQYAALARYVSKSLEVDFAPLV